MRMIEQNVKKLLDELPTGVEIVDAEKTRKTEEIMEEVDGGVKEDDR